MRVVVGVLVWVTMLMLVLVRMLMIVVMGMAMIVRMALMCLAYGDTVNRHIAGESAAAILAHVTTPPGW
jgi:hypothetical protein